MKIYKSKYVFLTIYCILGIEMFFRFYNNFSAVFPFNGSVVNFKFILNFLLMIMFCVFWIAIPVISSVIYHKYYVVSKEMKEMKKYGFEKNKDQFAKIVKNYSPAEINFLGDDKFNEVKNIALTLMSLKLKKKIRIENKKVIKTNDDLEYYDRDIKKSEKFILDSIKDGKIVVNINNPKYRELAVLEAIEDNLVSTRSDRQIEYDNSYIKFDSAANLIIVLITLLWFSIKLITVFYELFVIAVSMCVAIIVSGFFACYLIYKYLNYFKNIYEKVLARTNEGEKIYSKLVQLKKYMTYLENESDISKWKYYDYYNLLFDFDYNKLKEMCELIDINYSENMM